VGSVDSKRYRHRHQIQILRLRIGSDLCDVADGGYRTATPSSFAPAPVASTANSTNAVTTHGTGPIADCTTNHGRAGTPSRRRISASQPEARSPSTAARDNSDTPRPAREACLIAPFEPSVSVLGASSRLARNCSTNARVPDPRS